MPSLTAIQGTKPGDKKPQSVGARLTNAEYKLFKRMARDYKAPSLTQMARRMVCAYLREYALANGLPDVVDTTTEGMNK